MKKVFQKNQMIIMTLAVVIAVAGYVNYSQKYDSAGTNEKITVISIIGTVLILIGLVISQKN